MASGKEFAAAVEAKAKEDAAKKLEASKEAASKMAAKTGETVKETAGSIKFKASGLFGKLQREGYRLIIGCVTMSRYFVRQKTL